VVPPVFFREQNYKQVYLEAIYYTEKMKNEYQFQFTKGDPKKYYHALRINGGALGTSNELKFIKRDMEDIAIYLANKLNSNLFKNAKPFYLGSKEWEKRKNDLLNRE